MLPFIPLRLIGIAVGVITWAILARIATIGIQDNDKKSNANSDDDDADDKNTINSQVVQNDYRYAISRLCRFPCYVILFSLGFMAIKVSGTEKYASIQKRIKQNSVRNNGDDNDNASDGNEGGDSNKYFGVIGIFNHVSYVDAVVLMALFTPTGVSRTENKQIPIIGKDKSMTSDVVDNDSQNIYIVTLFHILNWE